MKIGVLALQGAFAEHRKMLEKLGIESFEIRKKSDLSDAVNNNDISIKGIKAMAEIMGISLHIA